MSETTTETPQEIPVADVDDPATATAEAVADDDPAPDAETGKGNREAPYRTERNAAREQVATLTLGSRSFSDSTSNERQPRSCQPRLICG